MRPRYRLPLATKEATTLLEESYLATLKARGGSYGIDEATRNTICLVARWLTGDAGNDKPSLLLYGDIGRGKTTLCSAVVRMVEQCKASIAAYSQANRWRLSKEDKQREWDWQRTATPEMITAVELAQADERELARIARASVLIIDDIGIEPVEVKRFGTATTPLVDVINERYANQRCTIITTNLDDDSVIERYGDRTEDRLREMCNKIAFSGESYRR